MVFGKRLLFLLTSVGSISAFLPVPSVISEPEISRLAVHLARSRRDLQRISPFPSFQSVRRSRSLSVSLSQDDQKATVGKGENQICLISRKTANSIILTGLLFSSTIQGVDPARAAEKLTAPSKNPYDDLQPAGISYLGNRGPNLQVGLLRCDHSVPADLFFPQLPETLSPDDQAPLAYKGLPQKSSAADGSFLKFRPVDIAGPWHCSCTLIDKHAAIFVSSRALSNPLRPLKLRHTPTPTPTPTPTHAHTHKHTRTCRGQLRWCGAWRCGWASST